MGFSNTLIYSRDTLTLSDVKVCLLSEQLRGQMKDLSDGSSGPSCGHSLFVEKEKYEKKGNVDVLNQGSPVREEIKRKKWQVLYL